VTGAASVAGRAVSSSGEPVRESTAHLVPVSALVSFDPGTVTDNVRSFLGDRGEFRFDVVPPGEYVLVIHAGFRDAFDRKGPTFYHPGVLEPAKATRIRIVDGKQFDLGDVKAPAIATYRPVDITVVDREGKTRQFDLRCIAVEPAGQSLYFSSDETGRTRLYLRPGTRFRIGVISEDDALDGAVEICPDGLVTPVKIVVSAPPPEQP
jgi:hypothetical protein